MSLARNDLLFPEPATTPAPDESGETVRVKCVSLWQPWSTLIAVGLKRFETRSWATPHRGPLLIHAAKAINADTRWACERFAAEMASAGVNVDRLPRGKVIAGCVLTDVRRVRRADEAPVAAGGGAAGPHRTMPPPPRPEFDYGDFSPGRFAWRLAAVTRLDEPIAVRGMQQLFDVEIPRSLFAEAFAAAASQLKESPS